LHAEQQNSVQAGANCRAVSVALAVQVIVTSRYSHLTKNRSPRPGKIHVLQAVYFRRTARNSWKASLCMVSRGVAARTSNASSRDAFSDAEGAPEPRPSSCNTPRESATVRRYFGSHRDVSFCAPRPVRSARSNLSECHRCVRLCRLAFAKWSSVCPSSQFRQRCDCFAAKGPTILRRYAAKAAMLPSFRHMGRLLA
jgi:hypothetical protein